MFKTAKINHKELELGYDLVDFLNDKGVTLAYPALTEYNRLECAYQILDALLKLIVNEGYDLNLTNALLSDMSEGSNNRAMNDRDKNIYNLVKNLADQYLKDDEHAQREAMVTACETLYFLEKNSSAMFKLKTEKQAGYQMVGECVDLMAPVANFALTEFIKLFKVDTKLKDTAILASALHALNPVPSGLILEIVKRDLEALQPHVMSLRDLVRHMYVKYLIKYEINFDNLIVRDMTPTGIERTASLILMDAYQDEKVFPGYNSNIESPWSYHKAELKISSDIWK